METRSVVLTFKSVDEILWCDHSNETSSAVLLHGTICFILQNKICDFSRIYLNTLFIGYIITIKKKKNCTLPYGPIKLYTTN